MKKVIQTLGIASLASLAIAQAQNLESELQNPQAQPQSAQESQEVKAQEASKDSIATQANRPNKRA